MKAIDQIVETGYFGDATPDEIRAVCGAATGYSEGYLLLPRGEYVGQPIQRMWTTNAYLQCDYVALDVTHSSVEEAAEALLRAVEAQLDESEEYTHPALED